VLLEHVGVHGDEGPDAEARELLDEVAAEAAAADHRDAAAAQAELVGGGDGLAVAAVAGGEEPGGEGHLLDLAEAAPEPDRRLLLGGPGQEVALGARDEELPQRVGGHGYPPPRSGKIPQ